MKKIFAMVALMLSLVMLASCKKTETVKLEFTKDSGVTVEVKKDDKVVKEADYAKFEKGDEVKFTITVPTGKVVDTVKVGDTPLTATSNVYTLKLDGDKKVVIAVKDAPAA